MTCKIIENSVPACVGSVGSLSLDREQYSCVHDLTESLYRRLRSWPKPIAVMGGHFMLMYSSNLDCLVPMIPGAPSFGQELSSIQPVAEAFAIDSLKVSAQLLSRLPSEAARLVLLVNDHQFQRIQKNVPREHGMLRQRFYRDNPDIPDSYRSILLEEGVDIERSILRNDLPSRKGRGILTKLTPYFSEQNLRNIFNDRTLPELQNLPEFECLEDKVGSRRLIYRRPGEKNPLPLTDDHALCGCSGEVVQLLRELTETRDINRPRARSALLIVPKDCATPVQIGVTAGLDLFKDLHSAGVVWGLERHHSLRAAFQEKDTEQNSDSRNT